MVCVQVLSRNSGAPQQSACVGIQVGTKGVAFTYTNSNGEARFPTLDAGDYEVQVDDRVLHRGRVEGRLVLYV